MIYNVIDGIPFHLSYKELLKQFWLYSVHLNSLGSAFCEMLCNCRVIISSFYSTFQPLLYAIVTSVLYIFQCWEWVCMWMGVICSCPPVRNDIETPRHLFSLFSLTRMYSLHFVHQPKVQRSNAFSRKKCCKSIMGKLSVFAPSNGPCLS